MKNLLFSFCLLIILMSSCEKEKIKLSSDDYLIFGHFYGFCVGEGCIEIFKLEEKKLFEDTKDVYPGSDKFYDGSYVELSQQDLADTKDLINYFPSDLLNETNNVLGQPDAGDWGGLYVEYNHNGIRKFWLIDQMKNHVPEKYHSFIDKVNEKIQQLQ